MILERETPQAASDMPPEFGFNKYILPFVPKEFSSLIIHYGAKNGREARFLYNYADRIPEVIAIDSDPAMHHISEEIFPNEFESLEKEGDYEFMSAVSAERLYFMTDALPDLSNMNRLVPGLKADFALCSGILMHLNPAHREEALDNMLDRLKPCGYLVIRSRDIAIEDMTGLAAKFKDKAAFQAIAPVPDSRDPNSIWQQVVLTRVQEPAPVF